MPCARPPSVQRGGWGWDSVGRKQPRRNRNASWRGSAGRTVSLALRGTAAEAVKPKPSTWRHARSPVGLECRARTATPDMDVSVAGSLSLSLSLLCSVGPAFRPLRVHCRPQSACSTCTVVKIHGASTPRQWLLCIDGSIPAPQGIFFNPRRPWPSGGAASLFINDQIVSSNVL